MTEFTFGVLSFFLSLGQASTQGRIGKYIDFKPKKHVPREQVFNRYLWDGIHVHT